MGRRRLRRTRKRTRVASGGGRCPDGWSLATRRLRSDVGVESERPGPGTHRCHNDRIIGRGRRRRIVRVVERRARGDARAAHRSMKAKGALTRARLGIRVARRTLGGAGAAARIGGADVCGRTRHQALVGDVGPGERTPLNPRNGRPECDRQVPRGRDPRGPAPKCARHVGSVLPGHARSVQAASRRGKGGEKWGRIARLPADEILKREDTDLSRG